MSFALPPRSGDLAGSRRRVRGRALVRLLLGLAAAGVLLVVGAVPAAAHNELVSTDPSDGQTLSATPSSVVLTFEEPAIAMGTQLVVTGPTGEVQAGAPQLVDNTVRQTLQPGAPAGSYTVAWRVTSVDGHPVSGSFGFTATGAGAGTPAVATPLGSPTPVSDPGRRPAIPAPLWIVGGVLLIVGAVYVARRGRTGE